MKNSYFGNPHGLPHHKSGSTVEDVAIVIAEALKINFFREVIKTKIYKCWI
jgi:D-alanyl-D-alanine carboxypeptidase